MNVAIIGTGISGITLALRLQQLGVDTTLFAQQSPAQHRVGRLENLVARFPATQDRERELGVAHWDDVEGCASWGIDLDVVGTPLGFRGRLDRPARGIDFRVYLTRLTGDYVERGGRLVVGPLPATARELAARSAGHEAIVVAVGRSAPLAASLFPVHGGRSPYSRPQRRLLGGLYRGVELSDRPAISYNIVPGAGEIFQQPFLTTGGLAAAILVEAVPGGPLEPVTALDPTVDAAGFATAFYETISQHAPNLAARIDRGRFRPLGERDVLRGAVTPTVRRGWTALSDGRIALAIGDAWITNDPVTGQGANLASHCAWHAAAALAGTTRVDETFAQRLEDELWSFAGPVTEWTNGFLQEPPPHVVDLLGAATAHQPLADAFARGFTDPAAFANILATEAGTAAFISDTLQPVQA